MRSTNEPNKGEYHQSTLQPMLLEPISATCYSYCDGVTADNMQLQLPQNSFITVLSRTLFCMHLISFWHGYFVCVLNNVGNIIKYKCNLPSMDLLYKNLNYNYPFLCVTVPPPLLSITTKSRNSLSHLYKTRRTLHCTSVSNPFRKQTNFDEKKNFYNKNVKYCAKFITINQN